MEIIQKTERDIDDAKLQVAKVEKKGGKRIGYYYIIIKSFKESQKNDVIKCLFIKGLTNFGFCVIKEGSKGDSKDKEGRDIRDRLMWQKHIHSQLAHQIKMPKLIDSFEENGNYYLVIEHINGEPLSANLKRNFREIQSAFRYGGKAGIKQLNYLVQIANILKDIHSNEYIHRDVTPANFMITPQGKVFVIDMELSYSLKGELSTPFQLGTYGYMSPQQRTMLPPVKEDDIFSLGAIMFQAITGIHPLKIVDSDDNRLDEKIRFFITNPGLSTLLSRCLSPDVMERPSIDDIKGVLADCRQEVLKKRPLLQTATGYTVNKELLTETVQSCIYTLSTKLLADEDKGWFSEDIYIKEKNSTNRINKAWYSSFYLGSSGVVYTLSKAKSIGFNIDCNDTYLTYALDLIKQKYIQRLDSVSPSLYYGASGIATVLKSSTNLFNSATDDIQDWITRLLSVKNTDKNLAYGVSGQGLAWLSCKSIVHPDLLKESTKIYTDNLIGCQNDDGSWINDTSRRRKRSFSLSSGISGIIVYLLEHFSKFPDKQTLVSIEKALNWLMKKSISKGQRICWNNDKNGFLNYGLLEGVAGIAYTFLQAYKILGNPAYKKFAEKCLLSNDAEMIDNNLSQATGLSGLGEVYLEAFNILKDQQWLKRAEWIAASTLHLHKKHPAYGIYWLTEIEKQPVPNFGKGNCGIIHFLIRYCNTDMGFPLISTH